MPRLRFFLGNPFKVKPPGPYERDESVLKHYRNWLWEQMKDKSGEVYLDFLRLASIAKTQPLNIFHAGALTNFALETFVKKALDFLIREGVAS